MSAERMRLLNTGSSMDTVRAYACNSATMWPHLAKDRTEYPGVGLVRGPRPDTIRVNIHEPTTRLSPEIAKALAEADQASVEDPFGKLDLPGFTRYEWPIMRRPATESVFQSHPRATEVTSPEDLLTAERVIIGGFPMTALQPYAPHRLLPEGLLDLPNWRAWTALRDGVPASACLTFDDGHLVCVYWLATLPEHRSYGLGRAVMNALLRAHEERDVVLVATEAGRPLYESLGFIREGTGTFLTRAR